MTLARGSRLGPYEISSLCGAGGMGEVYRARDTRLDRTVAIKVLPPSLTASEEQRIRFEREARAISALSHPNICALYDIGSDGGHEYLVMEFLDGETLAERLTRGAMPSSQVVRIGAQIAAALQQAHRAGITHRDLKPGNIMLTTSGAKLLDFGLAKFVEPPRIFSEHSAPVTRVEPLTAEGTIVGTMFYMSPEQLLGNAIDPRSDIFSFGVILYEMATGQRPFRGDAPASVIAAILSSDPPPVRSLQPGIAPALERIIVTALEKNPDERWQTAHDVGRQLRWLADTSLSATTEQPAASPARRVPLAALIAIAVLAAALLGWAGARFFTPSRTGSESVRMQIAPPPDLQLQRSSELNDFAISPDGRTLVFVARGEGGRSLVLRRLDSFQFTKVAATDGAASPFWSSDGEWIGYSAGGKLWKTKLAGGAPPVALCDVNAFGARGTWVGDTILFSELRGPRKEIQRVSSSGGVPANVTKLQRGDWRHEWPSLLPDGKHFLYAAFSAGTPERKLLLASLDERGESVMARNVSFARIAGSDLLLYVRDGNLLSQRIDVAKGIVRGEPSTVASDVSYFYPTARADFSASAAGIVVYRTDTSTGRLVMLNRGGAVTRTLDDQRLFWDQSVSRDGRKAAVSVVTRATGLMDIWIYDLARGMRERFTSDPSIEVSPAWAPDGRSIVYSQAEGGTFPHLVRRSLTGSVSEELTPKDSFQFSASFMRDGESLFYSNDAGKGTDILRLSMKNRRSEPAVDSSFNEVTPAASPDGAWLAYASNTTGAYEVYLQSLGGSEPLRIRISANGGSNPSWRGDAQELFFLSADNRVMSAKPSAAGRWEDAIVTELFRLEGDLRGFVALPDGQSFLVSDQKTGTADDLFHVVTGVQ
jgi:serine/threonine protein kinase/Tol biopolymer transport system component